MKFSANLGFLWSDLPLADGIRAAAKAGFDAVECHWPYDETVADVKAALAETGLPMLGVNTRKGDGMGLAALPSHQAEARAAIDEALAFAAATETSAVHVMAGVTEDPGAEATFLENLTYAAQSGCTILIEPLNVHDAPGYFLKNTAQAARIIAALGLPNVKLMFDCYHVGRTEGDVIARLKALLPIVGHIQFAAVPDRGPPDHGDLNYVEVFDQIAQLGWNRAIGAEYRPPGPVEDTLTWMAGR